MMKKLVSIALVGLSFVAVTSFASYPPMPAPGVSCVTAYQPPTPPVAGPDEQNFCGCYEESAVKQCKVLASHGFAPSRTCSGSFAALVTVTCGQVSITPGGVANFCKQNVSHLKSSGDSSTTVQDCIDDVGYICDAGGKSACTWQG